MKSIALCAMNMQASGLTGLQILLLTCYHKAARQRTMKRIAFCAACMPATESKVSKNQFMGRGRAARA